MRHVATPPSAREKKGFSLNRPRGTRLTSSMGGPGHPRATGLFCQRGGKSGPICKGKTAHERDFSGRGGRIFGIQGSSPRTEGSPAQPPLQGKLGFYHLSLFCGQDIGQAQPGGRGSRFPRTRRRKKQVTWDPRQVSHTSGAQPRWLETLRASQHSR